jgi:hypothetical protein
MATFNAEEKKKILDGIENMNLFMAANSEKIKNNNEFIEGNGHKGAKVRISSLEARVAMIFVIMAAIAGIAIKVFENFSTDLTRVMVYIANTPHP